MVDSRASMHMISRKDLNSAQLETVRISRCPTSVITANGEVQTHEEATVYVRNLDMFLTVKILEDTPAVLSLGKLCEDHVYSYEWANGQKPCLILSTCVSTHRQCWFCIFSARCALAIPAEFFPMFCQSVHCLALCGNFLSMALELYVCAVFFLM